ncbi:MAG: DUF5625 family protein [Negativicutes bacterium]|nr:DUF5625 family protein [Negativicutes bacterium]
MMKNKDRIAKYSLGGTLVLNILIFGVILPFGFPYLTGPPISGAAISTSPPGSLVIPFQIHSNNLYELVFQFRKDEYPIDDLIKLTGYGSLNKGVAIPVWWEIDSLPSQQCIYQEETNTKQAASFSRDYIERDIKTVQLSPGDYRLILHIKDDTPQFSAVQTRVRLQFHHAAYYSYLQWSSIFQLFVIFTDIIMALFLLVIAIPIFSRWRKPFM